MRGLNDVSTKKSIDDFLIFFHNMNTHIISKNNIKYLTTTESMIKHIENMIKRNVKMKCVISRMIFFAATE